MGGDEEKEDIYAANHQKGKLERILLSAGERAKATFLPSERVTEKREGCRQGREGARIDGHLPESRGRRKENRRTSRGSKKTHATQKKKRKKKKKGVLIWRDLATLKGKALRDLCVQTRGEAVLGRLQIGKDCR